MFKAEQKLSNTHRQTAHEAARDARPLESGRVCVRVCVCSLTRCACTHIVTQICYCLPLPPVCLSSLDPSSLLPHSSSSLAPSMSRGLKKPLEATCTFAPQNGLEPRVTANAFALPSFPSFSRIRVPFACRFHPLRGSCCCSALDLPPLLLPPASRSCDESDSWQPLLSLTSLFF